jgi:plastocyanin
MPKRGLLVAMTVLLVAAGCGDDGEEESEEAAATGSPPVELSGTVNDHGEADVSGDGDTAELAMELDDFYFGPTYVHGAPGQTVKIELENEGEVDHTFTIDDQSIDETVPPGESATVEVTLPSDGNLAFYCRLHRGQGMQGAFYLEAGASAPASTSSSSTTTTAAASTSSDDDYDY